MTLGQNIQAARKAKGLSQETLAEKIGVSRQALGKWEKDTALPGLDNLQALAAELGIGVDALLGTEPSAPAAPAVTLDAMRDLLSARDAEEKRRRRLWGCAGGATFLILAGLLAGMALQYERQINALNQNYAAIQSSYAAQQADLSAQISELQDAVRMGETTVLDWRWLPADKLHRDAAGSWMPVQVQVTPRTAAEGTSARLAVRCGDETRLYDMTAGADGSYTASGLVFTVGDNYALSVQWTADGVTTSEALGTVNFNEEMTKPTIIWATGYTSLDYGYYLRRTGKTNYLTLTCYPVELEVDAPAWMEVAAVEVDLRLNGDAGEPAATAVLQCAESYSYVGADRTGGVWSGTFYDGAPADGWPYDGKEIPKYVVRVTDTNGGVWTEEMPLTKK
ncbi:helix-turn-helix domain-containing protein [Gemmiger formicilis]|uniref:helix-turn-helix domain-containing protein n=1 Tax=Gemmiger formicilis TaxID=745368 RepID=UPI00210CA33A|nr:helix-turn-helix transcriptional regulator [Gemmiger formicilis]MCQ5078845.1 helix-turn-helix domain-containing protein [Gemmiger formicilis]MCQ5115829.1 helix-turn-helix domain-containing protein [Gemmiger formicilis]